MPKVTIGIPCFQGVPAETLEDYMRFMYYLGRRYPEHDFYLAIKSKSEQFRARNAIVEAALQVGSDYLFMLDDDHVIDWDESRGPSQRYEFLRVLISHLDGHPERGIVGALYYHRGGECRPVAMKEGPDGGYYFLADAELTGGLQEVDVAGGGALLIDMKVFDRVPSNCFRPEIDLGTDIQVCKAVKEAGYSVWLDSSQTLGHVKSSREVITPENRLQVAAQHAEGVDGDWRTNSAVALYREDAEEYLQMGFEAICDLANTYSMEGLDRGDLEDHYRNLGPEQVARQVWFHHLPVMVAQSKQIWDVFAQAKKCKGIDYGCGSAPVGFELVMRGHTVDFIDVDGAPAYEFLKWRATRRGVEKRCNWEMTGDYDFALFLDSIEHLEDWEGVLARVAAELKPQGVLITNYFQNEDYLNPEHVSMDKKAVEKHLLSLGLYPQGQSLWVKQQITKESAA